PSSDICTNGNYAILFPAPLLAVAVVGTGINATASSTGTTLTGGFQSDGTLLVGHTSATSIYNSCSHNGSPATLMSATESLTANFNGAHAFTGSYSILLNWDIAFCNCTKVFQVTANH